MSVSIRYQPGEQRRTFKAMGEMKAIYLSIPLQSDEVSTFGKSEVAAFEDRMPVRTDGVRCAVKHYFDVALVRHRPPFRLPRLPWLERDCLHALLRVS